MFNKTADRIMTKSTTGMDVLKYVVIGLTVVAAALAVIAIMKRRRADEAARNAETERILSTPLADDPLVEKYDPTDTQS